MNKLVNKKVNNKVINLLETLSDLGLELNYTEPINFDSYVIRVENFEDYFKVIFKRTESFQVWYSSILMKNTIKDFKDVQSMFDFIIKFSTEEKDY